MKKREQKHQKKMQNRNSSRSGGNPKKSSKSPRQQSEGSTNIEQRPGSAQELTKSQMIVQNLLEDGKKNQNNESLQQEQDDTFLEGEHSESQKHDSQKSPERQENEQGEEQKKQVQLFDNNADFLSFDDIELPQKQKNLEDEIKTKYNRELHYPWLTDQTMRIKDIHAFLHNEVLDFVKWIEPSDQRKQQTQNLVKRIKKVVKDSYPDATVMVFGSCATGLNLPNSDIDLLVYYPEVKEITQINRLGNQLLKTGMCKSLEQLKHIRVPLIKLQDRESNIQVDISFNRTNGIYCVKLVKFLQKKYPELRPMILVLKAFLKSRDLNETYHGGVGSFLLTMLVTSYLQRQYKIGGTDKIDLGRHLVEFFNLYGNVFNYDQVGISIRKEGSYFSKEKRGWEGFDDRSRGRLCVENPQDPEVDIGKNAYNIRRVQRAFQHAYDTLVFNNSNAESLLKLVINEPPANLKNE